MKTKTRQFISIQLLSTLVVLSALTACVIVVPARTKEPLVVEKGGCPDWGGRRLRSTNTVMTIQYTVGVGRISNDGAKGQITLAEKVITRNVYTPDVLALTFSPKPPLTELIRDPSRPQRVIADPGEKGGYTSQSIKQIRAPETFVDIVVLSEWEYEIRFYYPNQAIGKHDGFYRFAGEPYSLTRIKNPNPPNLDSLEITISKDGITKNSLYKYDIGSDGWTFFRDGVETVRKLSELNPSNPCERIETRFDLKEGSWFKTVKIFKGFPWGPDLIKVIEDPDGQARTTTYKYFEDPKGPHYTFLKTTIHPDGTVERHNRHPDPLKNVP